MNKLTYASPELELISFAAADIITTSVDDGGDDHDPDATT